ncbi:MAG TPA: translation initiation factor [Thermoanaerobaculia bacterium]
MPDSKLVWTSDPEAAKKLREEGKLDTPRDAEAGKQQIRVGLDKKRRAGKTVTVATGFQHTPESLAKIAQQLKKRCGSGGTVKDGEIEIQGDHLATVAGELEKLGYRVKRLQ